MDEKIIIMDFKRDSKNYYKYALTRGEIVGNIYIAKNIIETAPEKIQIVIRENKE